MICPNCNAEVSDSVKFCENCGAALSASGVSQEPAVQFDQQPTVDPNPVVQEPETSSYTYDQQGSTDPFANTQQSEMGSSAYDQQYGQGQQYGQQPAGDSYTSAYTYDQQQGDQFGGAPAGGTPTPPGVYTTPANGSQVSVAPFVLAIIALVTSILGLFPISIVLAIIALVMNSGQKKRGEFSTKQTPTTVMSIISLVLSAIMLVATLMLGGFLAAFVAAETQAQSSHTTAVSTSAKGTGSASASAPKSDAPADLAGTWKLTGLVSKGEVSSAEDIELMQNMGLKVELTLNADGTAALTLFGTDMNGTWSAPDAGTVSLAIQGETINAALTGNELVLSEGEDVLTFTKQ